MSDAQPEKFPSDVAAEEGQVIVDGPDGVAVTMSPDAAEETARRLSQTVEEARRQVPKGGSARP
jgi:hypothetical protein